MRAILVILVFLPDFLLAQNKPGTFLHIKKAKGEITLDGKLNEADWQAADVAKNWSLNFPVDTALAPYQTEARVTFDDQFFYVSFVCYDDNSRDLINSLRRDFEFPLNDNVGINFGPYNDGLNGFFFSITPAGVQREGTVSGGGAGTDAFNSFWDNKWYSKVVRYEDHWITEASIPWKSFRYKDGLKEWNVLFDRSDKKRNMRSSWIRTPIQFSTGMFAYSGSSYGMIPFRQRVPIYQSSRLQLAAFLRILKLSPKKPHPTSRRVLMQRLAITPSLNLDLTFNPDFSQVEVDQQVINLTRFEFQFPERRQFFLENSDLFNRAGLPEARPFFSRRIGLVRTSNGLFQKVPIVYGARVSGSINEDWRVNFMNIQTKEELSLGLPAQNYTVATIQRNFWRQSSFGITFVNKQSLGVTDADTSKYFHESIFQETLENGIPVLRRMSSTEFSISISKC